MAEVIPAPMAQAIKVQLTPLRFGRPKLKFEAPQVVLTFNSVRKRWTSSITWRPEVLIAPTGITKGSTTTSEAGIP